jgi:hypothetical protein
VEHWWNDTDRENTEILGELPVRMPLYVPQIPHGIWKTAGQNNMSRQLVAGICFVMFDVTTSWADLKIVKK